MQNVTKFKILQPTHEVFEAFVDPERIGNFWFSSSSERWEQGKIITLKYNEYNAELQIKVLEIEKDRKIVYQWGANGEGHIVTIMLNELDPSSTQIAITEDGFNENDAELIDQLLDNKEGWVFMLSCLKAYLEFGVNKIRGGLVK